MTMAMRRVQFMDDDDLAVVDAQLAGDHPAAPLYAVGFSAGANIVTKYLGRAKAATSIRVRHYFSSDLNQI